MKTNQTKQQIIRPIAQMRLFIVLLVGLSLAKGLLAQSPVHSWTFEDGTARDTAGAAHGALQNGASIKQGRLVLNNSQFVELPAYVININEFTEISVETWFTSPGTNPYYHMIWYFGNATPDPIATGETLGTNGFYLSPAREDNISRTAISTGNLNTPWLTETRVNGPELDNAGTLHHVVSIVNDTAIIMYIDSERIGYSLLANDSYGNRIDSLSNEYAWIGKGGYSFDPSWTGLIHEMNIYNRTLSASEIEEKYAKFPEPHNVTIYNIATTSADLQWNQLDSADQWDVTYGAPGFDPDIEGTMVEDIDERPYTLTDLLPGSYYEVYVRAHNDDQISNWSVSDTFATNCEVADLPFSEDFDALDKLPLCWSQTGSGSYYEAYLNSYTSSSDPNGIILEQSGGEIIFITPEIAEEISNTTIRFMAAHLGGNSILEVGVITDFNDPSSFTMVEIMAMNKGAQWNSYRFYLHEYEGTDGRIAIRLGSNEIDNGAIAIDDVNIEEIPDCPSPYNIMNTDFTTTTATIEWSQAGLLNSWNIEWGEAGFTQGNGYVENNISNPSITLSELTAGTAYEMYIQGICTDDETTEWVGPYTFNTQLCETSIQCMYEFEMLDDWGDGWNGAEMEIIQNGIVITSFGTDFVDGQSNTLQVGLCPDSDFAVVWNQGGFFPSEVGLTITDPFGTQLFHKELVGDSVGLMIYQDAVSCGTSTSTGLHKESENTEVYPNPFNSILNVNHIEGIERIVITNITGQTVMNIRTKPNSQQTIQTGHLKNGVYVVTLHTVDGRRSMHKMVKR